MIVVPSGLVIVNREMIIALAAAHHLPAIYPFKFFATSGGLATYGTDLPDLWRRAAEYVDRILRAGDLPVQAPTKFEFVLNLRLQTRSASLSLHRSSFLPSDVDETTREIRPN